MGMSTARLNNGDPLDSRDWLPIEPIPGIDS
jgi:hypothetical protein